MSDNNTVSLVSKAEEDKISRLMMAWINTAQNLPVVLINYEQLKADTTCMALSTIQGTAITKRYICGGHVAEYQYKLIYRIKPGTSNDKRLAADETLDQLADWSIANPPDLGDGIRVIKVEATTRSAMFAIYDNGDEDHQILMKLTYEVI